MKRAARAPGSALACALACAFACGNDEATRGAPTELDAATSTNDAAPETDVGADATFPVEPYPPGPYRGGIGDVMPDFSIIGYALSREHSDSTTLPFRTITLAEVRSDPACECIAIVHTACGTQCGPCVNHDRTITAIRAKDPSVCAMEVLSFNYDGNSNGQRDNEPQPTTRADVDAFTQSGRENYPVGFPTRSAAVALTDGIVHAIPMTYVVRKRDMRVVAYLEGSGENFERKLKAACNTVITDVRDVATGLSPRAIDADNRYVYASDWNRGLIRTLRAGDGPVEKIYDGERIHLVHVDVEEGVFFTTEGATTFALKRVSKTGGTPVKLLERDAAIHDFVLAGDALFVALGDGSIVTVPRAGGPATTLIVNEAPARRLRVDDTHIYWAAWDANEVARMPRAGGARETLVASGELIGGSPIGKWPRFIELRGDDLIIATPGSYFRMPKTGGPASSLGAVPAIVATASDGAALVFGTFHTINHVGSVLAAPPVDMGVTMITPGQANIGALLVSGPSVFWTTNVDDVTQNAGAIRAALRPR